MEWYRDDLEEARSRDPYPVLKQQLLDHGFTQVEIDAIENNANNYHYFTLVVTTLH